MKKCVCLFGCLILLLMACNSGDCPMNNTVYTNYALLKADGSPDTLRDSLTIVTERRLPDQDPVIVNRGINISSIIIPISYAAPEDVFYYFFKDDTGYYALDTVWVEKTDHPHFESVECNPSYFHTITDVRHTRNMIDSIVINQSQVNYDSSKDHFHLYLHPRP